MKREVLGRRGFLQSGSLLIGGALLGGARLPQAALTSGPGGKGNDEVSVSEDLMREHGVLKRVLLVYDEIADRLEGGKKFPPAALSESADIIRAFIEEYHERLEEDHLFPRFEKARRLTDLVSDLRIQHHRGRILTERIRKDATPTALHDQETQKRVAHSLRQFVRMYNPHEAREDTVLFPAFRTIVSPDEYDSLGEAFEKREHEMFGEDGFERNVEKVANIEKSLGIFDLSRFTPEIN
jgi:hemerythrin-like domain-containing protein